MKKVPKLRFKEFTGEWEEKRLGEILKIGNGKDYRGLNIGDIPVYGTGGIIAKVDNYLFDGESIGIGRKGTINKPMFLTGKFWTVDTLFYTYNFINSLPKFLYYIFNNIEWLSYNEATGVPSLSKSTILKIKQFFPNLQEQEKIANFLSSVDKKISLTEEKLELFKNYKKGIMQKIFSQKLRFKDENGNDYPEWEEKKLGEIAKFSKGKLISKEDIAEIGIECIRYGELYTTYKEVIDKTVSKTNLENSQLVFSEKNDIIIPSSGETSIDIAKASCVIRSGIALGGDLNILKTLKNGIFLSYYMNNKLKYQIASLAQGASVVHLYENHLKLLKLNLPCLEEQEKIANFLSSIDEKIEKIENELENLKEFKKGLLQQMFI